MGAAGTFFSATFTPPFRYTTSQPGWANWQDFRALYLLLPPGEAPQGVDENTSESIRVYRDVAAAPADCTDVADDPGASAQAMAAAIAAHPGLTVTDPAPVSVGGLNGVMIDISMASDWTGTCPDLPDAPTVPLLVGSGPSTGLRHDIRASYDTRLYLLDSDEGVVTIEALDHEGRMDLDGFDEVVTSFKFDLDAPMQSASPSPTEDASVVANFYALAGGHMVYMACAGTGSPTVVFGAGVGNGAEQYGPVRAAISQVTRTCAYDRPGTGRSGPASGCRDLDDLTAELAELLEVAGEKGPYVLVGASGGGFIAAGFAAENREDIAGMVFLDVPGHEFDPLPDVMETLACDYPFNSERTDFVGVEREAWEARAEIGDIPVTIISAEYGPDAPPEDQMNAEIQKGWLVLSPRATQVLVTTGHDVLTFQHELVIEAIEEVVLAARAP